MAPQTSQKAGAGRAAVQSRAFHALCAGEDDADQQIARLTPEERAELRAWKKPGPVQLHNGITLDYDNAYKECTVALDAQGNATNDESKALSVGHLDMAWVCQVDGTLVAYIVDIKRTAFTSPDGPESLQLHAYGMAFAAKHGCTAYVPGLWLLDEGQYQWGRMVDLYSLKAAGMLERVLAAASHDTGEYSTGSHCDRCYGRLHCPAWLLPVSDPESALAPLSEPGGITEDNELSVLLKYKAASDLLKRVKSTLEAYAERRGGIPDGEGKVWRKVTSEGGERFDAKAFQKEHPELHKKHTVKTGPKSLGFRWTNEKKEEM